MTRYQLQITDFKIVLNALSNDVQNSIPSTGQRPMGLGQLTQ